jgi:serine/threonine-protein kinase RsbW
VAEVVLSVPARHDYLALIRSVVTACAAQLDPALAESRLDDLRLAVTEACSNAADAHLRSGSREPLHVVCQVGPDHLTVTITDRGGGFDPDAAPVLPDAGEPGRLRHERGLGIPLMRILTDEVRFTATEGGTTVVLRVTRPPRS